MKGTARATTGVLVVEDHPMFRERLVQLLSKDAGLDVVGEADNVPEAVQFLINNAGEVGIIVLDITLKGRSGLDLLKEMKTQGIHIPTLVISMHDESLYAERSLRAGAKGYITKYSASEEVLAAVDKVLSGEIYLGPKITSKILDGLSTPRRVNGIAQLTDREVEIFRLIGCGATTREIAAQLHLGITTIETYRARIKAKLRLDSANRLSHRAVEWVQSTES